jgi:hypothetical protein
MKFEEEVQNAYAELMRLDEEQFIAEENRIIATQIREKAFLGAMEEAIADGIRDQAILQKKGDRGSREELQKLQESEKASRLAAHKCRQAGMKVDSLNKQMDAHKIFE